MHTMPIDAKPMNADIPGARGIGSIGLAKAAPPAQIGRTIWLRAVATDAPLAATAVSQSQRRKSRYPRWLSMTALPAGAS